MSDLSRYIGLEFEDKGRGPKYDCWGLAIMVFHEQFGIELPSYIGDYDTCMDGKEIEALVRQERETTWIPSDQPTFGDVIILRIQGMPWHCGVMVDHERFLHIQTGSNSCIERRESLKWARRIDGIYRYQLLAMAPI